MNKLITEPKKLYGFLATPGIEVKNLVFANDDVVWISSKYRAEEHVPSLRHTNAVLGAYVTEGATIHLYRYVGRLRENASYCNTDSVKYIQPRDEPELIETGDKLDEMTSELGPSQNILECVSVGPKNYAYSVQDTVVRTVVETVCKIWGVTLNSTPSDR